MTEIQVKWKVIFVHLEPQEKHMHAHSDVSFAINHWVFLEVSICIMQCVDCNDVLIHIVNVDNQLLAARHQIVSPNTVPMRELP